MQPFYLAKLAKITMRLTAISPVLTRGFERS